MKRIALLFGIAVLMYSCNQTTQDNTESTNVETTVEFISLKDFQNKAVNFIDKEVETQGIVDHVCKHGGKKLFLVADGADVHIFSDDRFDQDLMTKEIKVKGIVKEDRTDEASLLKLEEEAINEHSEGEAAESRQEQIMNYVKTMRDSLKNAGVDHFSEYYLEYVSHEEVAEEVIE